VLYHDTYVLEFKDSENKLTVIDVYWAWLE